MATAGSRPSRALAAVVALLAGCASGGAPAAPAVAVPPIERMVLATFGRAHEDLWRPAVAGFVERFRLRPVYAWPMESLDEVCVVFELPPDRTVPEMLELISANRLVRVASGVSRFRTLGAPAWNDSYVGLQHGLETLEVAAAQRWATGRGVKVAVVDTGVDLSHPDLEGRVSVARNFVPSGDETFTSDAHGTAVAGVIAARANNRIGIVGIAPEAELMALKACWPDPPASRQAACDSYTLARALDFAILSGAQVLNLSLAGPEDPLLERLLRRADEKGMVTVAAVDESGRSPFPASVPSVIAVRSAPLAPAAGAPLDATAGHGSDGALRAPGADILTTGPRGSYDFYSGSSLAAAHVSGVAALLLEHRPGLTSAELRRLLARPSGALPSPNRLSACTALGGLLEADVCGSEPARAAAP
jgi:hypothetical protein